MGFALVLYYVGRFVLGAAFVVFGIRNIANIARLTGAIDKKLPLAGLWIVAGVVIQIAGGAMVAIGVFAWLGALALVAFLLLAAYLFHPFWQFPAEERTPHINACIMNTGLSGAFLMVAAFSF